MACLRCERIADFGGNRFGGGNELLVGGYQGGLGMVADGQMQRIARTQGKVKARQQPLRLLLVMTAAGNASSGIVSECRDRAEGAGGGVGVEFAAAQPDAEG